MKNSKQLVRSNSLLSSKMMVRLQQQTQNRTKYIRFANSLHKDSHTICYYVVCYKAHFLMKVVYTDWFQPSGSDLQLGQPNLKLTATQLRATEFKIHKLSWATRPPCGNQSTFTTSAYVHFFLLTVWNVSKCSTWKEMKDLGPCRVIFLSMTNCR